jgi:hypothetical protein
MEASGSELEIRPPKDSAVADLLLPSTAFPGVSLRCSRNDNHTKILPHAIAVKAATHPRKGLPMAYLVLPSTPFSGVSV